MVGVAADTGPLWAQWRVCSTIMMCRDWTARVFCVHLVFSSLKFPFFWSILVQGLLAYVYDYLLYDSWVELNQCRFNHIGMDVLYRAPPSFQKKHKKVGTTEVILRRR